MTRWMGWALAAWIGLFAALSAWAEDAPAGAAEQASALVQAHRRAIEQGDLVAAKAALTALLQVAGQAASEDDTALLEALLDAYGAARRTLRGDADGALFAGKLLAALAQRAAKTDKDHALDVWTARAFARAHAELGAAEAFPEAAAELDRLRALAAEHAGVALVRESLALGLYNETVHVRRQQRPDARAPLLQELHALTQREDATPKTHEEYLWTLWDESDAALDRDAFEEAFAVFERMRAHVRSFPELPPSRALANALGAAYIRVGESEPFARGDALLEEVRLLAAREDASESVRDEYGTMLGNAIYARHRARAGEGIPGLLTASRALAARAEATPKQAGDHMRALRNAALHYASQGAWSEAKALRDEARAFLASQGPTEATSAQFTYLLSDVIAETVTLRAWAELETWLQDLAGHMPREGALGTEHRVHAESLVSAHLAAEEFGADDTLRQARLAALTRAVEAGGATPELLVLLGRALDNRHYFLVQRTEGPLPTDLLARLRATAARAPREGELAIDLAQALERSHGRALALGDEQGAALLLDELRARRTAGPDLPGVRVELLQALRAKHGRLGDAGAFAEADAYLVEMEGLIAREDVTSAEQALLIGAWADQLWDVLHKERVASVPELVQRAVILQQKIDTTDGGEDLLPRVLGQALLWAREAGEAEHERAWMAALRERAERTAASQLARDTLVRQLELVAVAAAEAQDLDALQAGAEELEALAGAADASAYMRRRWAAAWTDIHLEHLRAGRYPDAPALFLTVAALDAAHAPEERYDDLLAVMLLNHHWFGGKRGDTIEASAALAELRKLAAAEGAHPNTAWRLSEGLEAETRFLLERDADRAQSDAILSELRTLAERVGTDERVSDALAAALRQHHWHAGEAGRVPEAVSRKAELSLLAGRATATWKQRVDLAAVLADGVWDASAAEDFERADAWTAELRVLMALPEAPSAIRYQLARALHALHENALEDGRRKQVVGVLDDLRALCAHPDAPAGCHIELAAVLAAEGGRHAVSVGDRPVADRLVRELQERCARPGATELERDALAELLASLAHWRFLTSPDDPGADPEAGLRDLETLRALALREEASEEQQGALDGVLAGSIRTLVAWGRHAEAAAAVARLERRAGAAGAGSGTRKHHARALRERAFMHLEAGELEAALALVGQLQRLTDTRPNGTDYLGEFALSVAGVVDAARKAERSELVLPLIEVLERLARENPDQPLARLMLEQARK